MSMSSSASSSLSTMPLPLPLSLSGVVPASAAMVMPAATQLLPLPSLMSVTSGHGLGVAAALNGISARHSFRGMPGNALTSSSSSAATASSLSSSMGMPLSGHTNSSSSSSSSSSSVAQSSSSAISEAAVEEFLQHHHNPTSSTSSSSSRMDEVEQDANRATSSNISQLRKRPRGLSCEDSSNDDLFATVQYALDFPSDNPQDMDTSGQGLGPGQGTAASIHGLGAFDLTLPASSSSSSATTANPVAIGFNTGSTKVASAIASLITDRAQNGHGHGLVLGSQNGVNESLKRLAEIYLPPSSPF